MDVVEQVLRRLVSAHASVRCIVAVPRRCSWRQVADTRRSDTVTPARRHSHCRHCELVPRRGGLAGVAPLRGAHW